MMTLEDFRAMPREALETWINTTAAELAKMNDWIDRTQRDFALAYKVLKEKMVR
jgi:hypothetical protein